MTSTRLTSSRLAQLAGDLPARYTAPLPHLAAARILSGAQLDRLTAADHHALSADTAGRVRRRVMARLGALGLVATLDRRIGGVRAGSTAHLHTLTPAGYRLTALLAGQPDPARRRHSGRPGALFVEHALAISELYVQLTCAQQQHRFTLAHFTTEPACWWPTSGSGTLRPDAYVVLQAQTHADCWWLEIDQNTESLPRIRAKLTAYHHHATHGGTGPHDALPRVLFTTPTVERATAITRASNSEDHVTAICHTQAAHFMIAELNST